MFVGGFIAAHDNLSNKKTFKKLHCVTVMGLRASTLSQTPTWTGTWISSQYNGGVSGTMDVVLPVLPVHCDTVTTIKAEALITYDAKSFYRPGDKMLLQCTGEVCRGSIRALRSTTWMQIITYTATNVDYDAGKITGIYTSSFPSDAGTFELRRL